MLVLLDKNDIAGLKSFALTMIWAFPLVFMGVLPWLFEFAIPYWPAGVSLVLLVLYAVFPLGIYWPYRVWMMIAGVLGWINTRIILGLAFFLLILPIGLLLRMFGKLQYQAKKVKNQSSFWIKNDQPRTKDKLKEPF